MAPIKRPLSEKCKTCGGGGGRNVQKLQQHKQRVPDPKSGKMVEVVTNKTTTVWEPCRPCGGSGIAR